MRNHRLVLLLLLGCGGPAAAEDYVDPPGRVARVNFIDGAVSIAPAGSDEWGEAVLNRPLTTGDRISADTGARAELEVGSATLRLDQNTGFSFDNLTDDVMQIHLTSGVMMLHVGSLAASQIVEVATPNTNITFLQRGDYTIEAAESGDQTTVKIRSGEATVAGSSQQAYGVATNEQGVFNGTADLTAEISVVEPRTQFEDWAYAREVRDQQSITARYVSPEVIGYRDLDRYGVWYDEPEYGHVWRPTLLVDDWAPYRFGRWVWIPPWGWTWIDDAPWGFAPSHYGRWAYVHRRWCWVPGPPHIRPVYAPALVGWVGDPWANPGWVGDPWRNPGYAGNIGWFPLAPREAYLPCYRASWRHFHNVNVSNTVIVNNTYINDAYQGRAAPIDYHNRRVPDALTVVQHDAFVSSRRVGEHRARVTDDQLHTWRTQGRAPTIIPNNDSMIGTRVSTPRPAPHAGRWPISNRSSALQPPPPAERVPFAPQPRHADESHPDAANRPVPRVPTTTSSRHSRTDQGNANADRPVDATNQDHARTRPVNPGQPPAQHVQRQWDGRHPDAGTRVPGNVAPLRQPQFAPGATRPAPATHIRQTEPRRSENPQAAPRTSAPTAAGPPERAQSAQSEPRHASQRAALGTPHGRQGRHDNGAAQPHAPEQNERTAGGPRRQP